MTIQPAIEAQTRAAAAEIMTGAEMVVRALVDQGVTDLFGYPGGAVLPIYDALFHEPRLRHVLVRHEQGATHAAEGYARSTGRPGVVLVTSGPGATNSGSHNTFTVTGPAIPTVLKQGEKKTETLTVNRGSDFKKAVKFTAKVPEGVHAEFSKSTVEPSEK